MIQQNPRHDELLVVVPGPVTPSRQTFDKPSPGIKVIFERFRHLIRAINQRHHPVEFCDVNDCKRFDLRGSFFSYRSLVGPYESLSLEPIP
jgi:hypothetical protein